MDLAEYLMSRFRSQQEAAAALNVTQGTISHWTTGRRRPSPEKARQIVDASEGQVSLEEILYPRRRGIVRRAQRC